MGGEAARDLRGRRARPALRPARLRGGRAAAVRRPPLGARRRAASQVVVNWQAPAARPFYTATPADPQRVTLRRRFRAQGRRLLDIADESLDGSTARRRLGRRLPARGARAQPRLAHARHRRDDPGRPVPPDHARARPAARDPGRAGHRQDGGRPAPRVLAASTPSASGTPAAACSSSARTARSWSTSRTCCRRSARTASSSARSPSSSTASRPTLRDAPRGRAAEGGSADGGRRRGARSSCGSRATPEELNLKLEGEYIRVRAREVERLLAETRERHGTTAAARERFRMSLVRSFYAEYGAGPPAAARSATARRSRRRSGAAATSTASSSAPGRRSCRRSSSARSTRPRRRSRRRPRASSPPTSSGCCGGAERLERRRRAAARRGARARRRRRPRTYDHVIVDEAQDLTPMQLRMIARRARDGALTILGDVAQGTGAVAYESWDESCRTCRAAARLRSRSSATPTACRARSWSSRCRCWT